MAASLAELEARVAALEADRADYRAVLAAVNALGENQREHSTHIVRLTEAQQTLAARLSEIDGRTQSVDARLRSVEEHLAEMRDLLVRTLDRPE